MAKIMGHCVCIKMYSTNPRYCILVYAWANTLGRIHVLGRADVLIDKIYLFCITQSRNWPMFINHVGKNQQNQTCPLELCVSNAKHLQQYVKNLDTPDSAWRYWRGGYMPQSPDLPMTLARDILYVLHHTGTHHFNRRNASLNNTYRHMPVHPDSVGTSLGQMHESVSEWIDKQTRTFKTFMREQNGCQRIKHQTMQQCEMENTKIQIQEFVQKILAMAKEMPKVQENAEEQYVNMLPQSVFGNKYKRLSELLYI